jgi:hypothetical protein
MDSIYVSQLSDEIVLKACKQLDSHMIALKTGLIRELTDSIKNDIDIRIKGQITKDYKIINPESTYLGGTVVQNGNNGVWIDYLSIHDFFIKQVVKLFNSNEHIIYNGLVNANGKTIVVMTNFGNMYTTCFTWNCYYSQGSAVCNNPIPDVILNNIRLDVTFIKIIQLFPNDTKIDTLQKIIDMSKEYYIKFLTEFDLQTKYNVLIEENKKLQNEIIKLNEDIQDCKRIIKEAVPIENQCCICFGFTYKKQLLSPCGHTQYCEICIVKINKCALCKKDSNGIIKIF